VAPRSTGEIIFDVVDVLRRSFVVVFSFAVPFCAIDLLLREVAQTLLLHAVNDLELHATPGLDDLLSAAPKALAGVGGFLGSFVVQQLLLGGVVAVGGRVAAGAPATVRDALRSIVDRGAALVVTSLLLMLSLALVSSVVLGVPAAAAAVGGIALEQPMVIAIGLVVGLVGTLVALITLTLRWALYAPVVVFEGRSLFGALRRSAQLTAARGLPFAETPKFRLSVLFLVAMALSSVLQGLFLGPRIALAFATGWSFADGSIPGLAQMPVWFIVPFGLLEVVTNAAVIPFNALLLGLFTLDLRVRYEGADLDANDGANDGANDRAAAR
jgi:hypothetical protein